MRRALVLIIALGLLPLLTLAESKSRTYGGRSVARSKGTASRSRSVGGHTRSATKCTSCERDEQGRIKRDPAAKREFQRQARRPHRSPLSKLANEVIEPADDLIMPGIHDSWTNTGRDVKRSTRLWHRQPRASGYQATDR